jgi:signal transduction histidine kinase
MIAIGQMLQSALLVHVTGGRIETHFHVFGSLALLAFYRDWRVLVTATIVVYVDHLALGLWFPLSVYGAATATIWRSAEHAFWVIFEVGFLSMACHTGIRELRALAERSAALEDINRTLENRVRERTQALEASQLRLAQVAKFESVGQLAAGVAHEVKNPLATLLIGIEHLLETLPAGAPGIPTLLQDMQQAVRKADSVIKGLLDFSAPEKLELAAGDINASVEQALTLMKHEFVKRHVEVVRELAGPLPPVRFDRMKIEQVIVNLLMNASQAMPSGGTLTVRTSERQLRIPGLEQERRAGSLTRLEGRVVAIDVEDTGCGIPPKALARIFDPFFTTKPTGQGTGLGLTVSRKIVELHGGEIELVNRPGGGIRATVLFSALERPVESDASALAKPQSSLL